MFEKLEPGFNFLLSADIGQVYRRPGFHDLVLPLFQNNVGVVQGVVAGSKNLREVRGF